VNELYSWSLPIILFLQSLGDSLTGPMRFFSFLGYEEFFLFIAPALYWCLNASLGLQVGLLLMVSSGLNAAFKLLLHSPRPYWYDTRVSALSAETSFGIPSAHAQNAVVVWGVLAAWLQSGWAWLAASVVMLLIGISRMYLGVHFPIDVFTGWLIGAGVLVAFLIVKRPLSSWLGQLSPGAQILSALAGSLVLIALGLLARFSLGAWSVPADWSLQAAISTPGADPIDPLALASQFSYAGAFFGLALGAAWVRSQGGFDAGGPLWKRLVRFSLGLVGVFLLWYGLGRVLPRGETWLAYSLRYLRYGLVGVWITGLAPLIFFRLSLADRERPVI
jgi:membrane-associated phospholipid phosphatase